MRDDEISEHCLCDKCSGHDCGADNPEKRDAEEKKAREARDIDMREEGAKQERERLIGVFDIANGIDNCETCKFRPHDLMDCNLADVAILALGDWEQYCPIKKIVESLRGQHESKGEPE